MPKKLSTRELLGESVDEYELSNPVPSSPANENAEAIANGKAGLSSNRNLSRQAPCEEEETEEENDSNYSTNSLLKTLESLVQYRSLLVYKAAQKSDAICSFFQIFFFILLSYYLYLVWERSPRESMWLVPACYGCLFIYGLNKYGRRAWKISKKILPLTKRDATNYGEFIQSLWKYILLVVIWVFIIYVIVRATLEDTSVIVPLSGLVFLITICFILSTSPVHVKGGTLLWGLAIQFLLAYFITRTQFGHMVFYTISQWAKEFFGYASFGSKFIFNGLYNENFVFAIHALPLIVFLNSVVALLYYLGLMQFIIQSIARVLELTLGTSAPETVCAAANIFLGQVEAPLVILPYLSKLTRSELHAVMCGGFATISGAVLGVYLELGIAPTHLVAASVMNAPASLIFAKLVYPDHPGDVHKSVEHVNLSKSKEKNMIEAAANGACTAVPICLNMSANLIAFISLLEFLNASVSYFGGLIHHPDINLESLLAYAFYPVAMVLGLNGRETLIVAQLMGKKTIVNEYVAFQELSELIKADAISERAASLATYVICNFANISSLGIQLGGLGVLVAERKSDLVKVGLSALICGAIAPISNACIMAILFQNPTEPETQGTFLNSTLAILA